MNSWRITKYNPMYRNKDDAFLKKEWTSISDVGKSFDGKKVSLNEYLLTEDLYIKAIIEFINYLKISSLKVCQLEKYEESIQPDKYAEIYTMQMIEMLVQPFEEEYWENAAKILLRMGYPKVKEVIPNLFKWLEDLSKPGVKEIIELLKTVNRDVFINYFENAVKKAIKKNNKQLISNLSMFVDYFNIEEEGFTSVQVYPALMEVRKIN